VTTRSKDWIEGDAVNNSGLGGGFTTSPIASPTFAALQQAGQARPAYGRVKTPPRPPDGGAPTGVPPTDHPTDPPGTQPFTPKLPPGTAYTDPPRNPFRGAPQDPFAPPQKTPPLHPNGDGNGSQPGESPFERQLRERYEAGSHGPHFDGSTSSTSKELDPAILKGVMDMLANPSGYTTDVATSTYNRLGGAIDDQYNTDNARIDEEMSRRGIPVSTIAGGRLFDSNVARKSAKEDLAGRILTDQASTVGADRARAVAQAMGLSDDEFNRALSSYTTNRASDSQDFSEQEQRLKDYEGAGQQSFENQQSTQQTNNQQQQQMLEMLMRMFGGT
jgi:hypothetical protein